MPEIFELNRLSYVVVIGASVVNLMLGILDPTIGPYLENLGASGEEVGTVISARFLMVAIMSLPFAILASKIGNFRVLLIPVVSALLAGYVLLTMEGIQRMYYFYFIAGMAQASTSGPAAAILAENEGTKRIAAFSLFSISWMLPPAIGSALSFYWFRNNSSFDPKNIETIFPLIVAIGVIGTSLFFILLIKFRHEDTTSKEGIPIVQQFRIIFTPFVAVAVSLLILVNFLSGAGAGATIPFLGIYLASLGADAKLTSLLTLMLNLAMSIATQLIAPLAKKFGELQVFAFTQAMSIFCLLNIVFTDDLYISSIFFILRGMFANMNTPIMQSLTFNYVDSKVRATASAVITNIRWIGWSIFSPISGRIIDTRGFKVSFVFTSIIYLISAIIFLYVVTTKQNLVEYNEMEKSKLGQQSNFGTIDPNISLAE